MSGNKSYLAILPQTDCGGSLLFRFTPNKSLQCFADGAWYTISQESGEGSKTYSFQKPLEMDGLGTVYLDTFTAGSPADSNANKVVVTDATGKIPEDALPRIDSVTWLDLT